MTNQHPIIPPPELAMQWIKQLFDNSDDPVQSGYLLIKVAAQYGADQELEACCEWVSAINAKYGPRLRLARRPKPPSLKEQALAELAEWENVMDIAPDSPIRRALEALPND